MILPTPTHLTQLHLSYKNDSQIKAMTDLVDAYQRREVHTAEKILRGEHLDDLDCTWLTEIARKPIHNHG